MKFGDKEHCRKLAEMEKVMYCKVIELTRKGDPKPRVNRDGYTKQAGSPTHMMVRLDGETLWRRVYMWQFSNAATYFVRVKGECQIIPSHVFG